MHKSRLGNIVIDCQTDDLLSAAQFWSVALGYPLPQDPDATGRFIQLVTPPDDIYPPMDITVEQWDAAFDSQAKAFLVGVREAVSLMGKGGRILAITYAQGSRTGGLQPWMGMGSAKAALESLVRLTTR